jgi:hypothetical protein
MNIRSDRGIAFEGCSAACSVPGSSPGRPLRWGSSMVERVSVTPHRDVERSRRRRRFDSCPQHFIRGSSKKAYTRSVMNVGCRCRVSGAQLDSCAWTSVRTRPTELRGGSSTVERWSIGIRLDGHQTRSCVVRVPPAAFADVRSVGRAAGLRVRKVGGSSPLVRTTDYLTT